MLNNNLSTPTTDSPDRDYDVSAIIVNYNGGEILPRCLDALQKARGSLSLETIVVDNGSTDGSADLSSVQQRAKVVRLGGNLGFGRATNIGIREAAGRYYLLLNNDCFLRSGSLEAMMRLLETDRCAAVVGPRLLNADGTLQPSCHNFPSPLVFFLEQSGVWHLAPHIPGLSEKLSIAGDHASPAKVDWVIGACMLVRREALDESGLFDEEFFFYWEEADLCMRLRKLGWGVEFEPSAVAVHLGGASSANPYLLTHFFRSLRRFYRKHYSKRQLAAMVAIARCMALVKSARFSLERLTPRSHAKESARLELQARAWLRVAGL